MRNNLLISQLFLLSLVIGQNNYSLSFDGVNDHVDLVNYGVVGNNFTMEFWAKIQGEGLIFWQAKRPSFYFYYGDESSIEEDNEPNPITFMMDGGGGVYPIADTTIYDTTNWHYYTLVLNSSISKMRLYINSILVSENEVDGSYGEYLVFQSGFSILTANPNPFKGKIFDVKAWNHSRSQTQIASDMYDIFPNNTTGLVSHWRMSEGIGDTIYDYGTNGNYGLINGAVWNSDVPDLTAPATPTGLVAFPSNTQVTLTWTANSESDLASYKVYGGTSANPTTLLSTISVGTETYNHSSLTNGTTYYYRITTSDSAGNESGYSSEVSATPTPAWYVSVNGSDSNLGSYASPFVSIQKGLNSSSNGDTVLVQPGTYTENIFWPETNGIKLISAGDSSNTIIDGGGTSSVIYMNPQTATIDVTTLIQGFKITNGGNTTNGGGMVLNFSSPTIVGVTVTSNSASSYGGGMYLTGSSSPTLSNVNISNNSATTYGGGMYLTGSSGPTLSNVNISNNLVSSRGGGLYLESSSPTLTNVHISNNSATTYGGGMHMVSSSPTLTDVNISNNYGREGGGMCLTDASSPTFINVTFSDNSAGYGGGMCVYSSSPTLTDVSISNNSATTYGGGMLLNSTSPITTTNVRISNNSASKGGGIYLWSYGTTQTLTDVRISNNSATAYGGGMYLGASSSPMITGITITNNTASQGGGLYLDGSSSPTLNNDNIISNFASGDGDGLYISSGNPIISYSNIVKNGICVYNADNSNITQVQNNYWGHLSGPYHPSQNSTGQGDSVNVFVNVDPWITTPNTDAPPIPAQNLSTTATGNDFVSLAWDSSDIGDLAGYKVYYDIDTTGYPFANSIDVNNVTTYTLSNLTSATNYYIAVTTYDTDGNESWYSNEVTGTTRVMQVQNLDISGDEDLQHIITHTPTISFQYYDSMGENQTHYQIQVSTQSDYSSPDMWDSGEVSSSDNSITYDGNTLNDGQTYYLRVKTGSGGFWSNWSTLQFRMNSKPSSPVQISPINNEVSGAPVVLKVSNSTDIESDTKTYSFNVHSDINLTTKIDSVISVEEGTDTTNWQVTTTLLDNGQYWWTASVNDGYEESSISGTASFLLNSVNDAPPAFSLLSPVDSAEVTTLSPLLDWESSIDPDPLDTVRYTLYYGSSIPNLQSVNVDTPTLYQIPVSLTDNTTYYWKVVATDLSGATTENTDGYYSFRINTVNDLPGDFALLSPSNGSMITDLTPTFLWEEPTDPDDALHITSKKSGPNMVNGRIRSGILSISYYKFYLDSDSTFAGTTPVQVTSNSYTPTATLIEDTMYYWKVEVMDNDGGITNSSRWSFWTNSQNSAPSIFGLIEPIDNSELTTILPTFLWHASTDLDLNDELIYSLYMGEEIDSIKSIYSGADTTCTATANLLDNTTYYWKVVATDLSGATTNNIGGYSAFTLNSTNDPPIIVSLVTPDSVIEVDLTPLFYWTPATDPDPNDTVYYHLLWGLVESTNMDSIAIDTNSVILSTNLNDNSEYRWMINTYDNYGAMSVSETAIFWTDAYPEPPLSFTTIAPDDSDEGLVTSIEFIWQSTNDPDPLDEVNYTLVYATNWTDSSTYVSLENISDTTMSLTLQDNTEYFWIVEASDKDSLVTLSNEGVHKRFIVGILSSADEDIIPVEFSLHQNYPNPFNPVTTINYDLPEQSHVLITIHDILGREIRTLVNTTQDGGYRSVIWDGTNEFGRSVGTGIYLYQIKAGDYTQTKKMVLMK